ncbi:hypothetical protein [Hyphomonas sp. UBA4508]|uniref:hypothetical protein n=1 Tax=Hyphomonas sp. UBA4508 TaxID=1946633 RepID=UPI0025C0760B|nr:hypothetical protein [Hyphomonas sp. UBA4508]
MFRAAPNQECSKVSRAWRLAFIGAPFGFSRTFYNPFGRQIQRVFKKLPSRDTVTVEALEQLRCDNLTRASLHSFRSD